jgi:hypothetical protein
MPLQLIGQFGRPFAMKVLPLLVLISIGTCINALAQEEEQAPVAPTESIEEIVVYGDKSLATLKQVVFRAEENFFEVFGSLNNDDEFDIRCFYETPTGTRIRQHVCRANFVTAATSAEAGSWMTHGPKIPVPPAQTVIMQKRRHLQEKMEMLIATHPELLEALNKYTGAKQEFDTEREKKCEGRNLICRQ